MWSVEASSSATVTASMMMASDCDCPGPLPPEFLLPPPPRPPALHPIDPEYCADNPLTPIETCDALPLIDVSYRESPSLQTSAVIVLCCVLLGLAVFIGVILIWKHKRKVQNFLPCKTSPQNNCEGGPAVAAAIYEDLHDVLPRATHHRHHHVRHHHYNNTNNNHHHRHHHHHLIHHQRYHQTNGGSRITAPSIEMMDVKSSSNNLHYPSGYPISQHAPVFLCASPGPDPYCSQDLYNPVYEELTDGEDEEEDDDSDNVVTSTGGVDGEGGGEEDEFAESTDRGRRRRPPAVPLLEINGQAPPPYRFRTSPGLPPPPPPLPPTLSVIQSGSKGRQQHPQQQRVVERQRQQFHEGMLLDALLQYYPPAGNRGVPSTTLDSNHRRQIPSIAQRITATGAAATTVQNAAATAYEAVPIVSHLATFRPLPKPYSQDSAFGSDSGYSNHTSGTRGSSGRGRSRERDARRLSQLSSDITPT